MEVHPRVNSALAKRLWNVVRVSFFMLRKSFISKRKLIMDMNLMMKRGKLLRKSVANILSKNSGGTSYGLQEYEFSCSNSPNPVFFHPQKRKHHYFPCINLPEVVEEEEISDENHNMAMIMLPKTPEYSFNLHLDTSDFASGDQKRSPSPFSVRISNYSSEEEIDAGENRVDDEAEDFIKRFYEQLRNQSRMQLLQY
ncbi:hypothetical protein M5689_021204 [Euphorbia peplus]|nr:hypothetical protein M5689_021204 [Euphorbia peplus]